MELQKRYSAHESEHTWLQYWEEEKIYRFNEKADELFVIDTPPPTVSGAMHLGHAFSYAQTDFIARYQRMKGKGVFYPFGTDDNGLATERLIERMMGVKSTMMNRKAFIKLCLKTLEDIRPDFVQDWKNIGISCDFSIFYSTINEHCRRLSQWSFLDLYKKGREYRKEAPSIWCPECQTAIAQVELEDKKFTSTFNDIVFKVKGERLLAATTRPELLSSCVALFIHPDDKRYMAYVGEEAEVPLFGHKVPILMDKRVDPEKGTGLVMCCTFGDQTDIEWYKAHKLGLRISITRNGKMTSQAGPYAGIKIKEARKKIIDDLEKTGLLVNKTPIMHYVNVHERCGTPIEILNTKQWFIRYLDLKDEFLKAGADLIWHPEHMKVRLDHWINGLQWNWCISRQRHFGVPFPVWYCKACEEVILAQEQDLPVDPIEDTPPVSACPECGGKEFVPEKDVLDTWATSSLTPTITQELFKGKKEYRRLFPSTLRPQAHDIITFWLFNTLVKSQLHFGKNPWEQVAISGFALDPDGKKMSKSKGNVIAPQKMIKKYSADALRFWAAGSKLGEDLPFQEKDLVTGTKTTTKLWNASKFCLMHLENFEYGHVKPEVMDRWLLSKLQKLIGVCTHAFEGYAYAQAKTETEKFFWHTFCDNYLELVKDRLYNPDEYHKGALASAQFGIYEGLLNVLKLFAPILPFITEEIYQLYFAEKEKKKSIHISFWPKYIKKYEDIEAERAGDLAIALIGAVRKYKSEKNLSLREPLEKLIIECDEATRKKIGLVLRDIQATAKVRDIGFGLGRSAVIDGLRISIVA